MSKVAIYARVSTVDKQDYNRQISDCMIAIDNKYHIDDIEIFAEQISGYKPSAKRPQLIKMLDIIDNNESYFDRIYITEISRLGRDPKATRNLIDDLTEKKIPVFITSINKQTLDENLERDTTMNIVIQVLIEFSDSESKTMKKRTKSGLLQSAKDGKAGAGKYLPYGYKKLENKQLVIDEEEAITIIEIFDLYKKGNGFKKIAGYLNEKKVPTRVNKSFGSQLMKFRTEKTADEIIWVDKTVDEIIKNTIYKGQRRFKGQILDAPAIISTELFNECENVRQTKTHRNYLTKYDFLLKDLLTCGICGRNYFAKYKPQTTKGDKVYICSSRLKKGGNCGNQGVNITFLDSIIYDMLIGSKVLLKYLDNTDDLKSNILIELDNLNKQLSFEESLLKKQQNKEMRLINLYENSEMTVQLYVQRSKIIKNDTQIIKERIKLLTNSLKDQNDILIKIVNIGDGSEYVQNLTNNRTEIIHIFKKFIKKVYITKMSFEGDMLIDLHITMSNNKEGSSLKLMIDQYATRMKSKTVYSYRLTGDTLVTRYDNNGILITTHDEIYDQFSLFAGLQKYIVPDENILVMGNQDITKI